MNPLNSVLGAITTGIVLVILLALILTGQSVAISQLHLDRWLHIVSGITWIGLLYYFNVVQVPGQRRLTKAARAAPESASTLHHVHYCGFAGQLSPPGSPVLTT